MITLSITATESARIVSAQGAHVDQGPSGVVRFTADVGGVARTG
jgi:hypothetical protein